MAISEKVRINEDYITLGQFLKFTSIISNGSHAKFFLSENEVYVNGELENRRGRKLYPGYNVVVFGVVYIVE